MGAHVLSCHENPKYQIFQEKRKNTKGERLEKNNPLIAINKYCKKCGNKFSYSIRKNSSYCKEYCSRRCANSFGGKIKTTRKSHRKMKKERTACVCRNCLVHFTPIKGKLVFCSKECLKTYGVSPETSAKLSKSLKGKTGGWRNFGGNGKKGKINGILYQSSWEKVWIEYHLKHKIPFRRCTEYFKYTFDGKERKYYPDFFLLETNTYIEVKGFWSDATAAKIAAIPKNFTVKVLGKGEIDLLRE
jgi:hypothetical protein